MEVERVRQWGRTRLNANNINNRENFVARKSQHEIPSGQDLPPEIVAHLRALHLHAIGDYQAWCIANGFDPSLAKSPSQRERERRAYQALAVKERLKAHNREHNLRRQLRVMVETGARDFGFGNNLLHEMHARLARAADRALLAETFTYLENETDLLEEVAYVHGIDRLVAHAARWIRPLKAWTPKTHNRARQFGSLARHLFARYDVPAFMDSAWLSGSGAHQYWFIHIGQGGSIRTAPKLPFALTRKMAHCFMQAPNQLTASGAIRWSQVIALGGSRELAQAVNETRLARRFKDNDFWATVLQFFVRHPMLDVAHVNPIMDYIWNQKYESQGEGVEDGVVRQLGPMQPNFTMRGRTPESLLRQVEAWHQRLGRMTSATGLRWRRAPIREFEHVEGALHSQNRKIWRIREILSGDELLAEGRAQRHCVGSYERSCYRRTTSIWTLGLVERTGVSKRVTIEVRLPSKIICQVRGRRNRLADAKERDVVQRWAQQEGLKAADLL